MDSIIIRKNKGANPERYPRNQDLSHEVAELAEKALPVLGPPKTEFEHHSVVEGAIEGDIVPNPNTDVNAARANVLRAYSNIEALK